MDKTAINIKESHIINEKERVITISVLDNCDDTTAKEIMRKVKALSSDEIVKQTKWIEVDEPDTRNENPDIGFMYRRGIFLADPVRYVMFIYYHGILRIDNVQLIVAMGSVGYVGCVNGGDKNV